jgi:phospholipid/cholesterol/gamma-HCH transport system ATP-binding protein
MAEPILQFEDVSLSYDDKLVVDRVNLAIYPGDTYILLGAAGSGKTLLLKLAMSLIQPDSGRIRLLGHDITRLKETELFEIRSEVGILFQEGGLFDSLTVEDNVAYPLRNQKRRFAPEDEIAVRVKESLEFVELGHTLDKFPSELSGGMRRRVGIARANVTNPKLSLYDSPTAGLDPITAFTIMSLVIKQRELLKTTTVLVTHRYQDGAMAANFRWDAKRNDIVRAAPGREYANLNTTFVVMDSGRMVFCGTQKELEASRDPYVSQFVLHQPPPKSGVDGGWGQHSV